MTNQQQYEEICEKARKCEKYVDAIYLIIHDMERIAKNKLIPEADEMLKRCMEIVKSRLMQVEVKK